MRCIRLWGWSDGYPNSGWGTQMRLIARFSGKLHICCCIAVGVNFYGYPVKQGPVIRAFYVEHDDTIIIEVIEVNKHDY